MLHWHVFQERSKNMLQVQAPALTSTVCRRPRQHRQHHRELQTPLMSATSWHSQTRQDHQRQHRLISWRHRTAFPFTQFVYWAPRPCGHRGAAAGALGTAAQPLRFTPSELLVLQKYTPGFFQPKDSSYRAAASELLLAAEQP